MYKNVVKPFLDSVVALLAFIMLCPVFLMAMIILALANAGTPFFT
jgi:lipopolysaccharide/colanic/teichoic acid biosynthesis glycosyltransferase